MPQASLLPEIGLYVIDHIGAEGAHECSNNLGEAKYLRTLCICALICKDWLHRSRVNLFWTVYIEDEDALDSLEQALDANPLFRYLIHDIKFTAPRLESISSVPIHRALLLLRKIGPCTIDLAVWFDIRLNIVTRRCISQRYHNIIQLSVNNVPASRVFHLIGAFPSLRTLECSGIRNDEDMNSNISTHIASRVCHLSRLTVKLNKNPHESGHNFEVNRNFACNIATVFCHSITHMYIPVKHCSSLDGRILNLSEFPRLCSLALQFHQPLDKSSLKAIARLLSHSRPCPALQALHIKLDDVINDLASKTEGLSHWKYSALCDRIEQSILSLEKKEETKAVFLTFKITKSLSADIAARIDDDVRFAFPKLYRNGTLKTEFTATDRNLNEIDEDTASSWHYIVSTSGKWIACHKQYDGKPNVIVWDSQTRIIRTTITGGDTPLIFLPSPNGLEDFIVVLKFKSSSHGRVPVIWDHFHGEIVATLDDGRTEDIRNPCTRAFGEFLLIADIAAGTVSIWRMSNFDLVHRTDVKSPVSRPWNTLFNHLRQLTGFSQVSPSNKWLLVRFRPEAIYEICVWNTTTWELGPTIPHHEKPTTHFRMDAAFSDGDNSIVAVCSCGDVETFNFHTEVPRVTFLTDASGDRRSPMEHEYGCVQLSPDGRLLCWASTTATNRAVNMSDTRTGALLWSVGCQYSYLHSSYRISFSPDGQYVATSYFGYALRLWRVADGKCVASEGMGGFMASIQFSRMGQVLILSTWESAPRREGAVKVLPLQELLERED